MSSPDLSFSPQEPSLPVVPVPPTALDALSDEGLDALPYGVICLDPSGRIVRYNLAESRLARLDRNQVLGRTFFGQVAPCTATPGFQGRFATFTAPGATEPSTRFEYIFDFKFGAQAVDVELFRSPSPERTYVVINRRKFLPQRAVPAETLAPRQAELAPDEVSLGVLRDAGERRRVRVSPLLFASLRASWDRVAPKGWGVFSDEWGFQFGRLAVVDLETIVLEKTERTMRELPMKQVMELASDYLASEGWGRLVVDFAPAGKGAIVLTLERGAIAESVGISEVPRCHLLSGFFRALFCHLANKLIVVRECACRSQGFDACSFLVVAQERKVALEAAIEAAEGDVPAALAALARRS